MQSIEHLSQQDRDLIHEAVKYLNKTFIPDKRFVAAALQTTDGKILHGFNIHTTLTKASICAEAIVLGEMLRTNATCAKIVCVTSHRAALSEPFIVSPCGMCRELLNDYAPKGEIIVVDTTDKVMKVPISTLLPVRYQSIPV